MFALVVRQGRVWLQAVVLLLRIAGRSLMVLNSSLAVRVRNRLVTQSRGSVRRTPSVRLRSLLVSAYVVVAQFVLVIVLSGKQLELAGTLRSRLVVSRLLVRGLVGGRHQVGLEHWNLHHRVNLI